MTWKLTLALVLAALFVLFLLLNSGTVDLNVVTHAYRVSKGIVFFSIFVFGVVTGILLKG
jgi:uncharacterized integral membrane protein